MKRIFLLLLIAAITIIPEVSFGWGSAGHQMVAQIASKCLSDKARDLVKAHLAGLTFEQASVWMDEMRHNADYDFMKTLHYINIDKGAAYKPIAGENAVNSIIQASRELKHKKVLCNEQVRFDLLLLFHLMGDIHQPLHAGYGVDKGGNDIKVTFLDKQSNLHWVWDDEIIQDQKISLDDCMQLYSRLSKNDIEKIKSADVVEWVNESRAALDAVYDFKDNKIGEPYCVKNKDLIEKRILYAGLRLCAMLEQYFGSDTMAIAASTNVTEAKPTGKGGPIPATEVSKHIGENGTVCGKVYGGKFLGPKGPTFINMGAPYPQSPFTVVIFNADRANFSYKPEDYLDGKEICVTGLIKEYKGKAEIVVTKEAQIVISK